MMHTNFPALYSKELLSDGDSVLFLCKELNDRSGNGSIDGDINLDQAASVQVTDKLRAIEVVPCPFQ